MEIYLGFDPGGKKCFGWAVCSPEAHILRVLNFGKANDAMSAICEALSTISNEETIIGVGIDAPLFWAENGKRDVDKMIRNAIQKLGAPFPAGTVQEINSLRGSCLVQGILTAHFLHQRFPDIAITEAHPKALLYLMGIASQKRNHADVILSDLSKYIDCNHNCGEDERDAILGAITAFAQREKREDWRNLFENEKHPILPFDYTVGYWMPWSLIES